jgi:transcriptional regulator with XRE-family HTH domain
MKGTALKTVIQKHGYRQVEVAKRLNESQQNFSSMLNADDVRSSLIERISEALSIPVSVIYGESVAPSISANNGIAAINSPGVVNGQVDKCLDLLKEKDVQIEKLLDIIKNTTK